MTKILILNGSPRKNGNTEKLVESFVEGTKGKADAEVLRVSDFDVHPCCGCNACKANSSGRCVVHDDMMFFWEKLSKTDILVIASPVYFYGISAQLKALVDRFHCPARKFLPIKKIGLLLVAADTREGVFDSILVQYRHIMDFFHLESIGEICVPGVRERDDIIGNPLLEEAKQMGNNIL